MKRRKTALVLVIIISLIVGNMPSFSVRGAETSASMSAVDYLAFCNKIMSDFSRYKELKKVKAITISNKEDFIAFQEFLNSGLAWYMAETKTAYIQTADITVSNYTFGYDKKTAFAQVYENGELKAQIAPDQKVYAPDDLTEEMTFEKCGLSEKFAFSSSKDSGARYLYSKYCGNDHVIRGALFYNGAGGLFDCGGDMTGLTVENCMAYGVNTGSYQLGILFGGGAPSVQNCEVKNCIVANGEHMGIFIGNADTMSNFRVAQCTASNNKVFSNKTYNNHNTSNAGGLIGYLKYYRNDITMIENCVLENNKIEGTNAGGLIGQLYDSRDYYRGKTDNCRLEIAQCRSDAIVQGTKSGGIIGCITNNDNYNPSDQSQQSQFHIEQVKCSGQIMSNESDISETQVLGGIVGNITDGDGQIKLRDMVFTGSFVCPNNINDTYIGGVCGQNNRYRTIIENVGCTTSIDYNGNTGHIVAGGILGRGYCTQQSYIDSPSTIAKKYPFVNCLSVMNVPKKNDIDDESKIQIGTLAGAQKLNAWKHCYAYTENGALPLIAEVGEGEMSGCYLLTKEQLEGKESQDPISSEEGTYANTTAVCTALNNYIEKCDTSDEIHAKWYQGKEQYQPLQLMEDTEALGYKKGRIKEVTVKDFLDNTASPTPKVTPKVTQRPKVSTKPKSKYYPAPKVKVVPKRTKSGQRYLRVSLRRQQNCYIQFYGKTKKGYVLLKLKNNHLTKKHRKVDIKYSRKIKKITYKVRIYKKVNGRRKYSKFTKAKTLRLK